MAQMTMKVIQELIRKYDLYSTPELNEKLYLNHKGFKKIENLEQFTDLRCVYMDANGFTSIDNGLEKNTKLRMLYLHDNYIGSMAGISHLIELDTLNMSHNAIKQISHIDTLKQLNTLLLSKNWLKTTDDIKALLTCPSLSVVDVSDNKLEDPAVLDIFAALPNLKVLYLKGNPVVPKIKDYRRTVISRCTKLTYLDDRPVFPEERLLVTAWAKGGIEGEKAERERQRLEQRHLDDTYHERFAKWVGSEKAKIAAANADSKTNDATPAPDADTKSASAATSAIAGDEKSAPVATAATSTATTSTSTSSDVPALERADPKVSESTAPTVTATSEHKQHTPPPKSSAGARRMMIEELADDSTDTAPAAAPIVASKPAASSPFDIKGMPVKASPAASTTAPPKSKVFITEVDAPATATADTATVAAPITSTTHTETVTTAAAPAPAPVASASLAASDLEELD